MNETLFVGFKINLTVIKRKPNRQSQKQNKKRRRERERNNEMVKTNFHFCFLVLRQDRLFVRE